jgi:hypothetical protein
MIVEGAVDVEPHRASRIAHRASRIAHSAQRSVLWRPVL